MTLAGVDTAELTLTLSVGRGRLVLRRDEGRVVLAAPDDDASAALVADLVEYPMFFALAQSEWPSSEPSAPK